MPTDHDLASSLHRIDGRPYPAYKDLRGRYDFDRFVLSIDHVQGDVTDRAAVEQAHVHGKPFLFGDSVYLVLKRR